MGTETARVSEETATRLKELAQARQVSRTLDSVRQADAGEFASEADVKQAFAKWGADIDRTCK